MKKVTVILDMQFGSTGKGQLAGTLGREWEADTCVCANGPNAGHTYKWVNGQSLNHVMHTVMPVAAVLPTVRNVLLGPGAVIDVRRLHQELIASPKGAFSGKTLIIHPNAMIARDEHREAEKGLVKIGSTMKGTAAAMIEKIQRSNGIAAIAKGQIPYILENIEPGLDFADMAFACNEQRYNDALATSDRLVVEGAQGHSLSIHSQFYPYCTSRDVSLAQVWADCRLPSWQEVRELNVVGVCRTYPIRVANRFNEDGNQVGTSGGHYDDQAEISWEDLGREPELTTVTRLPRRVFTFSTRQVIDAARINGPQAMALTFCDYLPGMRNKLVPPVGSEVSSDVMHLVRKVHAATGAKVNWLSYGPTDQDMFSLGSDGRLYPVIVPW